MRLHGIARRLLPVLMALLLMAMPHAHAHAMHDSGVTVEAVQDGEDQGGQVVPCDVHCSACHAASLPPMGFEATHSIMAIRLAMAAGDTFRLGRAGDTPQRPPRLAMTA